MTDVDALLLFITLALKKEKICAIEYHCNRAILMVTIALANKNLLKSDEREIHVFFCENPSNNITSVALMMKRSSLREAYLPRLLIF